MQDIDNSLAQRGRISLTHNDRMWEIWLSQGTIKTASGKIGGKTCERDVKPKTAMGKSNPAWEVKSLSWKKFRSGFAYRASGDGPLRFQVATPDRMDVEAGALALLPDHRAIVVAQHSDGNGSRIHRIDLASAHGDHQYQVLDGDDVLLRAQLPPSGGRCHAVALSPDGRMVAAGWPPAYDQPDDVNSILRIHDIDADDTTTVDMGYVTQYDAMLWGARLAVVERHKPLGFWDMNGRRTDDTIEGGLVTTGGGIISLWQTELDTG